MRKEDFCDMLGDINEAFVKEAQMPRKGKKAILAKWGTVAACLAVIAMIGICTMGKRPLETKDPAQAPSLIVNEADSITNMDMDAQFTYYKNSLPNVWKAVQDDFYAFLGIHYDEFTSKLPDIWELSDFYAASVPGYQNGESDGKYRLHDYVFRYETDRGGSAIIAVCAFEEPLRDCIIVCDDPVRSAIKNTSLVVYHYAGCYVVQFSHNNVNYDIETQNVTLEELQGLLLGILNDPSAN